MPPLSKRMAVTVVVSSCPSRAVECQLHLDFIDLAVCFSLVRQLLTGYFGVSSMSSKVFRRSERGTVCTARVHCAAILLASIAAAPSCASAETGIVNLRGGPANPAIVLIPSVFASCQL